MQAAVRRFLPVPAGGISCPECRGLGCIYNPPIDTVLHDIPCGPTGPVLGEDRVVYQVPCRLGPSSLLDIPIRLDLIPAGSAKI
ncbi:hypothetical protein PspLS_11011 [Pyricularia sp. CBS 133598]|nr:hypothetical protein PspLS_11011 [Pyricularia sp. CBS 133598]